MQRDTRSKHPLFLYHHADATNYLCGGTVKLLDSRQKLSFQVSLSTLTIYFHALCRQVVFACCVLRWSCRFSNEQM